MMHFCLWILFLSLQIVQTLMKCRHMRHFIWFFTVCQSTCLLLTRMKRVNQTGLMSRLFQANRWVPSQIVGFCHCHAHMGLHARKPVFRCLGTTKAQTSLHICTDWSAPLFFAFWKVPYLSKQCTVCQSACFLVSRMKRVNMYHHADENSGDLDQLASSEASWSGSTLFSKGTCTQQTHNVEITLYIIQYLHFQSKPLMNL